MSKVTNGMLDLIAAVDDAAARSNWEFLPEGAARQDCVANEIQSDWGPTPLLDAYKTGSLFWYLAADNARAVCDVVDRERALGVFGVSRALAESCSRGWFYLEPEVAPMERFERMINDRLHALFEDRRMTKDVPELASSDQEASRDRVLEIASQDGFAVTPEARRSAYVGRERPTTMNLLGRLLDNAPLAAMFYRTSSGMAHGGLHTLVRRFDFYSAADDIYRVKVRAPDLAESATELTAPVTAFVYFARALVYQTGWPSDDVEQACQDLGERLADALDDGAVTNP